MKRFFYLLVVVGVVLTGCKDNNSPENSAFTFSEDVSKPLEFDNGETERALNFMAQADWSASIQDVTSQANKQAKKSPQKAAENSATWVTVSPMSGQKGKQQITITCEPNNKETERSATITISDGVNTITITIVQEAQSADFDIFSVMDDAEFKVYCEQFDTNKDGKLSLDEANAVKNIDVHGEHDEYNSLGEIQSLKGIAFFTNLEELKCEYNKITSLDVSKNTALERLNCNSNQLTSLNVSGCTKLKRLDINICKKLTSLDVSKNTALEDLNCCNDNLISLDVSGCTALTSLDCSENQLNSLNVSNNTALITLFCYSNQLTSLDVSKNILLGYLYCYSNQLTSLDVSNNTALIDFYCYSNQLISLDVSKNILLGYLYCYSNQLTSLDVSNNTALRELWCNENKIPSLDVSACTALTYLNCVSNPLQTLYMKTEQISIVNLLKPDETNIVYK